MLDDTNVYYMDVNRDNAIVHVNINNPNPVVLTEANIEHYNVYGSLISISAVVIILHCVL